jgi:hypothetical protein
MLSTRILSPLGMMLIMWYFVNQGRAYSLWEAVGSAFRGPDRRRGSAWRKLGTIDRRSTSSAPSFQAAPAARLVNTILADSPYAGSIAFLRSELTLTTAGAPWPAVQGVALLQPLRPESWTAPVMSTEPLVASS